MKNKKEFLKAWRDTVCKNAERLDAEADKGGQDWESLFVGFALGKGLTLDEALDYSFYIHEAFPFEGDPDKEVA